MIAEYDVGEGVMVTGASGWEYTTPDHERTCKVYVKTELQNAGPAPRCVLSFTVLFAPAIGALANASATDDNEQEWGKMAQGMPLHTSPRLAELSGVAGALDKDGYLLQAQP